MSRTEGWRRLHPLSPIVRGGRGSIATVIVLAPTVVRGEVTSGAVTPLIAVCVIVLLGFVSWYVTRWKVDGDDLRIERGVLRRRSLRFPLSQVQAIDLVRPGLARVFGLAELRLRMGGSSGGAARLAYLPSADAERVRSQLLALAHTGRPAETADPAGAGASTTAAGAPPRLITTVPTGRLVASVVLSDAGIYSGSVLAALAAMAILVPTVEATVVRTGFVWIVGAVGVTWRRFNTEYRLTLSEAGDGLHLAGGLVATTHETIRAGRIQAVRVVEPLLWRPFGWRRLEVELAGRQKGEGEGSAQRRSLRTLVPAGDRRLVDDVLARILPDRPPGTLSPPPARARYKSPLRYRMLGWSGTGTCVVATSGRLQRTTSWVPLAKVQSLRRVEGPVQRRLQLASVHLDTAGRSVRTTLRDRDRREADRLLWQLADQARAARRAAQATAPPAPPP